MISILTASTRRFPLRITLAGCLTLCGILLATSECRGAFLTFDNGAGTNVWHTGVNWSSNNVPTYNDYATINGGRTVTSSANNNRADFIDVLGNATLNITGGTLDFGGGNNRYFWVGFNTPGTVNQTGGVVTGHGNNTDLVIDTFGTYNLSGGTINSSDDMWLLNNAVLNVSGSASINVNDDFGVPANTSATINFILTGTQAPMIVVGDDLRLQNGIALNINTTNWNGADTVQLFTVNGNTFQNFSSVTVDGRSVSPSSYGFSGSTFSILVPEPASVMAPGLMLLMGVGVLRRQRTSTTLL